MAAPASLVAILASILIACAGGGSGETAVRRGRLLTDQARYEEAQRVLVEAVARADTMPGPSLDRGLAYYGLGYLYLQYPPLAEPGEAADLLDRALSEYEAVLGPNPAVAIVLSVRAEVAEEYGDAAGAARFRERAIAILREKFPPDHLLMTSLARGTPIPLHPDEVSWVQLQSGSNDAGSGDSGSDNSATSVPGDAPISVNSEGTFLRANITKPDGTPGYLHVTESDMPWVISIGHPRQAAKYASRKKTREVAIESIRLWETGIQPHLPWFKLVFVEDDPNAPVQVKWKRRITGSYGGFGGQRWWVSKGRVRVGGAMEISTTPGTFQTLAIDDIAVLLTHEFGHVLGVGHCLDCDSAMNYSWATRGRIHVTPLDIRTFLALVAQTNSF